MSTKVRLSDRDRGIIAAAMLQADRTAKEIAALTHCREHVVHRTLKRVERSGVLLRRTFINMFALGYYPMSIYFSCSALTRTGRDKVENHLKDHSRVSHLARIGGDFEYSMDVCVRSPLDLRGFLEKLAELGPIIQSKELSAIYALTDYPIKIFGPASHNVTPLRIEMGTPVASIDTLDHDILCLLSTGKVEHKKHIAQLLCTPESTISYRIDKLHERRVIAGTRYIVDSNLLGLQVFEYVLKLSRPEKAARRTLLDYCRSHPNIVYSLECVGANDFRFAAVTEDTATLVDILAEVRCKVVSSAPRIQIIPILGLLKSSFYPFARSEANGSNDVREL